ncbi:hypothetical protein [Pseudolabrys taiwanensis]|uniref:hypothetical protein n=1 Tax=Pseudolabrys taiwanensis TaxID=331696 RepID=UPI0013B3D456|nr:hypothetical protein [Pseudolabrys taiwanensis]
MAGATVIDGGLRATALAETRPVASATSASSASHAPHDYAAYRKQAHRLRQEAIEAAARSLFRACRGKPTPQKE